MTLRISNSCQGLVVPDVVVAAAAVGVWNCAFNCFHSLTTMLLLLLLLLLSLTTFKQDKVDLTAKTRKSLFLCWNIRNCLSKSCLRFCSTNTYSTYFEKNLNGKQETHVNTTIQNFS